MLLRYDGWLKIYGQESCNGCHYSIPLHARCTYKGKCVRYEEYVRDEKERLKGPTLFDID